MNVESLYESGWPLLEEKRVNEARNVFETACSLNPTWEKPYYGLGVCAKEERMFEEARRYYKRSIELNPNWERPYYGIGDSYRCEDKFQDALGYYRTAAEKNPNWPGAFERVGTCLKYLTEFDEAIKWFEKSLSLDNGHSKSYFGIGECLRMSDRAEESIPYYKQALQLDSANYQALSGLGQAYTKLERYEEALPLLKSSVRIHTDSWESYYFLAEAYFHNQEPEKAEYCYRLALEKNKSIAKVYEGLGMVYLDMEEFDMARKIAQEGILRNPAWDEPYGIMGQAFSFENDFHKAIFYFNQQTERNPTSSRPYYGKGEAYFRLNAFEAAVLNYEKAIEMEPDWNRPYSGLGDCYRFRNQIEKAKTFFHQSIKLDPSWFAPYFGLGDCFEREGNIPEARNWYSKALELAPERQKYLPFAGLGSCCFSEKEYEKAKNYFYQSLDVYEINNPSYLKLFMLPSSVFNAADPSKSSFLYRFVYVNTHLRQGQLLTLIEYSLLQDAPAFTAIVLHKYNGFDFERLSSFQQLQPLVRLLEPLEQQLFIWLQKNQNDRHALLFKSICEFNLGNPESVYYILGHLLNSGIPDLPLWVDYYYLISGQALLINESTSVQSYFVPKASEAIANETASAEQIYYAALILHLGEKSYEALAALSKLAKQNYFPAMCQILRLRFILKIIPENSLEEECDELQMRLRLSENFFSKPKAIPISLNSQQAMEDLLPLMQLMECRDLLEFGHSVRSGRLSKVKTLYNPFDSATFFLQYLKFPSHSEEEALNTFKETDPSGFTNLFGADPVPLKEDVYQAAGKQIFSEAFVIYYKIKDSLRNIEWTFDYKFFLQMTAQHYKAGYLDLEQTTTLQEYILYCMERISSLTDYEGVSIMLDEVKGLINTAGYVGVGYGTLERIVRYGYKKAVGIDSPIIPFEEFVGFIQEKSKPKSVSEDS